MNYGIEDTKVKAVVNGLAVRSCKGIANVVPFYDSGIGRSCYGNGGANRTVYGFYLTHEGESYGYWFKRKQDAVFGAEWVTSNDYDGNSDLEIELQSAMSTEWFKDRKGEYPELGKVYF
jgi:hypothetical protein